MASTLKFPNVIMCEDVREEARNKKSLLGVFSGDILVASMPALIPLAFYVEYSGGEVGDTIKFDVFVGKLKGSGSVTIEASNRQGSVVFSRAAASFDGPGTVKMFVTVNNGRKKTLLSKTVSVGEIPP